MAQDCNRLHGLIRRRQNHKFIRDCIYPHTQNTVSNIIIHYQTFLLPKALNYLTLMLCAITAYNLGHCPTACSDYCYLTANNSTDSAPLFRLLSPLSLPTFCRLSPVSDFTLPSHCRTLDFCRIPHFCFRLTKRDFVDITSKVLRDLPLRPKSATEVG
jgi:hypothetical protein